MSKRVLSNPLPKCRRGASDSLLRSPEACSASQNLPASSKAGALIKLIQLRQRRGENKKVSAGWEGFKEDENKKRIHWRNKTANPPERDSHLLVHASPEGPSSKPLAGGSLGLHWTDGRGPGWGWKKQESELTNTSAHSLSPPLTPSHKP